MTGALEGLREIPLPPPIAYVPQTVGWLIVGVALTAALAWVAWRRHVRWVANRYRRAALAELAEIERGLAIESERSRAAAALPALLKRTALAFAPRETVARLTDVEWLAFLDRTCPPGGFTSGPGRLLPQLAYDGTARIAEAELRELVALTHRWIERHDARV